MATMVLIHGAWHDGSAWDVVGRRLQEQGHRVFAPTAAGHGKGADKDVDLETATGSLVDALVDRDLRDVVLVGHSLGGIYISKVAMAVPERIRRLVFVNAFVLEDGASLQTTIPPPVAALFDQLAAGSDDHTHLLPWPIWREAFINDAGLDLARQAYESLSPQPHRTFTDTVDMKPFYEMVQGGRFGCSYLHLTEDTALPPGEAWGWHPRLSARLGVYRLVTMPGSHEVIFTNPELLADKLVLAARD